MVTFIQIYCLTLLVAVCSVIASAQTVPDTEKKNQPVAASQSAAAPPGSQTIPENAVHRSPQTTVKLTYHFDTRSYPTLNLLTSNESDNDEKRN